ncbi:hypothetical protein ABZ807_09535 [Micromonospora sp. NPDC047548]
MTPRWNFRLGPIQFTGAFGALSWGIVAVVVLICCCAGIIGTVQG